MRYEFMAISGVIWLFLVNLIIACLVMISFVIILFIRFFQKKTVGTILLAITFLFLTLGELVLLISFFINYYAPQQKIIFGILQLSYIPFTGIGYIFLYLFANRYIIEDNDLVRSLISILMTAFLGIITGLWYGEMINQVSDPKFYTIVYSQILQIERVNPSIMTSLLLLIPLFLLIHVRIVVKISQIQKELENPVLKRGFLYILLSVSFFFISTIVIALNAISGFCR